MLHSYNRNSHVRLINYSFDASALHQSSSSGEQQWWSEWIRQKWNFQPREWHTHQWGWISRHLCLYINNETLCDTYLILVFRFPKLVLLLARLVFLNQTLPLESRRRRRRRKRRQKWTGSRVLLNWDVAAYASWTLHRLWTTDYLSSTSGIAFWQRTLYSRNSLYVPCFGSLGARDVMLSPSGLVCCLALQWNTSKEWCLGCTDDSKTRDWIPHLYVLNNYITAQSF